jgi:hypothetical protein
VPEFESNSLRQQVLYLQSLSVIVQIHLDFPGLLLTSTLKLDRRAPGEATFCLVERGFSLPSTPVVPVRIEAVTEI